MVSPMPAEQICSWISYSRDSGFPGKTFDSCDTELDTLEYSLLITSIFLAFNDKKVDESGKVLQISFFFALEKVSHRNVFKG